MRKTSRILALMFVAFMILGSIQVDTVTNIDQSMSTQTDILSPAGYDSSNISASLFSLANGSTVTEPFSITLNMSSDFTSLNETLFVEGAIVSGFDHNNITASSSWTEVLSSIDPAQFVDGMLNFTILFEYFAEKETVYILYFVDNDGINVSATLTNPANGSTISSTVSIDFNVTSDVESLNLTVYVDGEKYSSKFVGTGENSVSVDTLTLFEGYDNFTLFFQYDVLATYFSYSMYIVYLVNNNPEPIVINHQSPANQTEVSGVFDLYLEIGSDFEPLEFTLFVGGVIHQYNKTLLGIKNQIVPINTTGLDEGPQTFTLFFYYNATISATYTLVFTVNNHGAPQIVILSPEPESTITGLAYLWLNITSTHPNLYLNVTVDGVNTAEFNGTAISSGAFNYTFNSSRYENGNHEIIIIAYTGEGASASKSIHLHFLDYVRVWISSIANYATIKGDEDIRLRVESAYDNATASFYLDGDPISGLQNLDIYPGSNNFNFNSTSYSEGEHEFMVVANDGFGHEWKAHLIIIIDNKGAPTLSFATRDSVVIGLATFTINVESKWEDLTLEVLVDDEAVAAYDNVTVDVSSGSISFTIDVSNYAKTEHTVKVVLTTPEGDSAEAERVFGFASLRIEEIVSMGILIGLAIIIPLYRKKQGYSLRTVLMVDAIFALVVAGIFLVIGISTLPFLLWHVNLASIWAIGGILVFTNWALPFLVEEPDE